MDTYGSQGPLEGKSNGNRPRQHQVAIAEADFDFRPVAVDSPTVTARQLLDMAGFTPAEEHLLFQVTGDGVLQERRLEEPLTLREGEEDRFIAFKSDRSFRVAIDGRRFEWGAAGLTGLIAKQLVGADLGSTKVWQERGNGADLPIDDTDVVKLAEEGVERLRTSGVFELCIEGETFQWPNPTITTEEIAELGGWGPSEGVQRLDLATNEVRTLSPGEVVDLRSVSNFVKKVGFRRG